MRCPVCKAEVEQAPACRRCRADLSLLVAVTAASRRAVQDARTLAGAGRCEAALAALRRAAALQDSEEARRLAAALRLLCGDFPAAWDAYQRHRQNS